MTTSASNQLSPPTLFPPKSLVLVGMPGSGKSTIGRKLSMRLRLPFIDSDQEIEAAAGMPIPQLFEKLGEPAFRDGERKVIARLLQQSRIILATGGGAFMNKSTRQNIKDKALSIWLKADVKLLVKRTSRTDDRPLLRGGDPSIILYNLLKKRESIYALADLAVTTDERPVEEMVERVILTLQTYLDSRHTP
jgi:shikimate kinase